MREMLVGGQAQSRQALAPRPPRNQAASPKQACPHFLGVCLPLSYSLGGVDELSNFYSHAPKQGRRPTMAKPGSRFSFFLSETHFSKQLTKKEN